MRKKRLSKRRPTTRDNERSNPKHLAFIRTLPCCRTGVLRDIEAAHVRKGTDGGIGLKPSDRWTVPLTSEQHRLQHNRGEESFWGDMDRVRQLARDLYSLSGDREQAIFRIMKFQRGQ